VGASLGIQADSRPLPLLGVELGYQGSRNPFENIDGGLWRHNVGALAKVGPELGRNGGLQPFVGAGFGVSSLNPSSNAEPLFDTDFVTEVPLAAGIDYKFGAVAAAALLAVPAFAASNGGEYIYDENQQSRGALHDFGVSVSGGLNTYTGDLANLTGVGGSLGIQADARPLRMLGLELGYQGSRNPFVDIDGGLWRHNVGALAKLGPELGARGNLQPFVGAGFGVSSLNPSGSAERIFSNDFVTEVPLAAGVDYKFGGVRAGARATYSILGGENLGAGQSGNDVNFGLNVGGAF